MKTHTMKIKTLQGKEIILYAAVSGHDETGNIPILEIPQMDDQQWERLAKGGTLCQS